MNKFLFKSADADFQKLLQSIDTLQKNILYITHRVDAIDKNVRKIVTDKSLQTQVDEYFEETSPQTDSVGTHSEGQV